jgi:hemerythrin-like domain-containing protein
METDTRQLMKELREDHRNMTQVLNVLEQVGESARTGEDPDFELVDEIMRYMTVYPDAVHHPKEDIVYNELKSNRPELADGLGGIPKEHQEIAVLGMKLRDDVEAIIAGAAVLRVQLVNDLNEYVSRLRKHMQWEEDDLFQRIDEMLGEQPVTVDVEAFQHIKDPVFELEVESAFRRLLVSLKAL